MIQKDFWRRQREAGRGYVKLDEDRVRRIKVRIANGDVLAQIARDESVSASAVGDIKSGRIWAHILAD